MKIYEYRPKSVVAAFTAVLLLCGVAGVQASINGTTGTAFNWAVKKDYVSTADGGSMLLWGYADITGGDARAQYPGPTLIVNEGDDVSITLFNDLTVSGSGPAPNVSIVFPGQAVSTSCASAVPDSCPTGDLTMEVKPGIISGTYTFTAGKPGTYTYHSGTNPSLQVEMGLTGAIIVRPAGFNDADDAARTAYGHPDTAYTREELFFLTEMDPNIHQSIDLYGPGPDNTELQPLLDNYFSNYWFINGRTAPDNFVGDFVDWLPTQPYNSVPRMHPGETVLMRVVGGGRDMHPFHHHGNHAKVIARDGRMLSSVNSSDPTYLNVGPDIATEGFTITSTPGKTVDALFTWTGAGLNWDIYGGSDIWPDMAHECTDLDGDGFNDVNDADHRLNEYCPDHGKPFPVILPGNQELAFGGWWGGSPYLGSLGTLPPGEGGLNPNGGFSFMWHSHTEKELTNWDIFPGGMLTMMIIEAGNIPIVE